MTFDPARRRDKVAGDRARRIPADLHEETREDFLRRHEREAEDAARGDKAMKQCFVAKLLPRTADTRNLRLTWDHLAHGDGQAPGLDGLRCNDLEAVEVWGLARTLHTALLNDSYRPARDRTKAIPKSSGKGFRTLSIPSVIDRVVQRAVVQTVQPYLDPFFDELSFGYRPHGHVHKALAAAGRLTVENDAWVWLTEDLRDAFDNVPQRRLLDVLRTYVPDEGMMRLIERVVLTRTGRSLRQGGNLSPLLLNAYLHHFLDRRWRRPHPDVVLIRWADDLLVLCRDKEEAERAHKDLQRLLLPAGMSLKSNSEKAVHDLKNGESAEWLGYRLFRGEDGLKVSLTERAWSSLGRKLELDHTKDGSPLRATETIIGWVSQMGPCSDQTDVNQAYARIEALAHNLAFDEIPSREEIHRRWRAAHREWVRVRDGGGVGGDAGGGSARLQRRPAGTRRAGVAS